MLQIRTLLLMFICLLCHMVPAAEADGLAKKIDLDLWQKNLGDVVSGLTEKTGIDVRISPELIRPRDFDRHHFYFSGKDMPIKLVLEWICLSLNARYRQDSPTSIWISGSYDWLTKEDKAVMIESIAPLVSPETNMADLRADLTELIKVTSLFPYYSLRVEEEDQKVVAILPKRIKSLLQQAIRAMAHPGMAVNEGSPLSFSKDQTDLLTLLRKQVVLQAKDWTLQQILADIQLQTGVLLAIDPEVMRSRKTTAITIESNQPMSLRQALESLSTTLKLSGIDLYPPKGIYLSLGPRKWVSGGSRRFLWEELTVQSYSIRLLAKASGGQAVSDARSRPPLGLIQPRLCFFTRRAAISLSWHRQRSNVKYNEPSSSFPRRPERPDD